MVRARHVEAPGRPGARGHPGRGLGLEDQGARASGARASVQSPERRRRARVSSRASGARTSAQAPAGGGGLSARGHAVPCGSLTTAPRPPRRGYGASGSARRGENVGRASDLAAQDPLVRPGDDRRNHGSCPSLPGNLPRRRGAAVAALAVTGLAGDPSRRAAPVRGPPVRVGGREPFDAPAGGHGRAPQRGRGERPPQPARCGVRRAAPEPAGASGQEP